VSIPLLPLIFLVAISPVAFPFDGPLVLGIWSAIVAITLIFAGAKLWLAEISPGGSIIGTYAIITLLPALFLAFQLMPFPLTFQFANPIWQSASAALGTPLVASVTIDTGATLIALCRYLAWAGVALVAASICVDRRRAEWILFVVTVVTVLVSLVFLVDDAEGWLDRWLDESSDPVGRAAALNVSALGITLLTACALRAFERFETHRAESEAIRSLRFNVLACLFGWIICAIAVLVNGTPNTLFSVGGGLWTLFTVVVVRRLGFGALGLLAIVGVSCALTGEIIAAKLSQSNGDLTLQFAQASPSTAISARMLADGLWAGNGAGTFEGLVPIYRGANDGQGDLKPPSTAAEVVIELGRPMLWAGVLLSLLTIAALMRASINRGRDFFYSAAGAATLVSSIFLAFGNPGLFNSGNLIIVGVILGLAIAQGRSRSTI